MAAKSTAKKVTSKSSAEAMEQVVPASGAPMPTPHRLRQLKIRNFRCIGPDAITIELDDIVVLVGANNAGKSTILRAYEVVMGEAKLTLADFPGGKVDPANLPEIEIHVTAPDEPPAAKWINADGIVRERWRWEAEGQAAIRQGFDVTLDDWSDNMPWGAANVAKARRPQPHRIGAFDAPEEQGKQITALLLSSLKQKIEALEVDSENEDGSRAKTPYGELLDTFSGLQRLIVDQAREDINRVRKFRSIGVGTAA